MDPLTHTLVGANLAGTRLGAKTRLGAAALIVGANLPDLDAILYFTGHSDLALGFRRGWTHGVVALVVLPFVLTGVLMLVARAMDATVSPRWLLLLSFVSILTHPALDWLNNYGMRWLMPLSGTWSYGDSVFIMDPWLWLILGCAWLAGRRPSAAMLAAFAFVVLALAWVVGRRSSSYLIVVGVVAVILFAAMFWRPKRELSTAALILAGCYIGARLLIHHATVIEVRRELAPEKLMVAPHPIDPTHWDVVAQVGDVYRHGRYDWRGRKLTLAPDAIPVAKPSPEWTMAREAPSIRGFITWVRFPAYEVQRTQAETRVFVFDARYASRGRNAFGSRVVVIPAANRHETPTSAAP